MKTREETSSSGIGISPCSSFDPTYVACWGISPTAPPVFQLTPALSHLEHELKCWKGRLTASDRADIHKAIRRIVNRYLRDTRSTRGA